MARYNSITDIVGGTPLLRLKGTNIYAKLEYFNPLHSVKDRAALFMIEGAEKSGTLPPGGTIIEPTSGNTGIALAYIGRQKGYKTIMVMPASMSAERKKLMRALGAELVLTEASGGMAAAVAKANELAASIEGSFIPMQFVNPDNARAHRETTAPEIIADLGDVVPDFAVFCVGSGGTVTGAGRALKERYPDIKIVAVEPAESPLISEGRAAPHKIQGIGANFIPALLDKSVVDKVITVKGDDAVACARKAATDYGTLVGISSGAALSASLMLAKEYPSANIVTLFPDTGERYLSTELYPE